MQNFISFPNLNLSFNINPVAFSVGQKPIYWYGILIALGFLLSTFYAMKRSPKFGFNEDIILDTLILVIPLSIICARIYFVVFSLHLYDNFWDIFKIWEGGIAIYGGVIGGIIGFFISSKIKKVDFLALLDVGACSILLGQAIGRWGNFVNAEAYGSQTNSLFMMTFGSEIGFHPTFLYESVWNIVGFVLLYVISNKYYIFQGQMSLCYLSWYGFGRAIIEGLRTDSLWFGNFRVSQILAIVTFIISTATLIYLIKNPQKRLALKSNYMNNADENQEKLTENKENDDEIT